MKRSVNIKFFDIEEEELSYLREIEEQFPNDIMLVVTKNAFDGLEYASLIVDALGLLITIFEKIQEWQEKKPRKVDITRESNDGTIRKCESSELTEKEINDILDEAFKMW